MRVALCLLTYNERPCLEQIFPLIPAPSLDSGFDQLVAVDGGSTDGTEEYYRERGVRVIGQSRRGRGDALLLAFEQVDADAYIFFSPDGNEDGRDLPKFKPLLEGGADLVIASRMMRGAVNEEDIHLLKPRKWANNALNLLANILFRRVGPFVTDSINGYRAITRRAAHELKLDALDYTIEYQMTIRALKKRIAIVEFPTREGARVAGITGARSFPTGIRFLKRLWMELR
jgi:glycosyltransferase involved in cell wall biosynthesis